MKWPFYVRMRAEAKARKERRLGMEAGRLHVVNNPHLLMEASSAIILELTELRAEARKAEHTAQPKAKEKASV